MRFLAVFSSGSFLLLAMGLMLLNDPAARAQQAGDTTSVQCGPSQPLLLCVDLDGRASVDSLAGPFTYQWQMGDGTNLTGPMVSHCYKERRNYVVQLDVVVVKTGEIRRGQKYIPVNLVSQDVVDFTTQPSRVRVGQSVAFAAPEAQLLTCQNVKLIWDFRDGTITQGRTAQHVFSRPGTYAVRFSMRGYGSNACIASHCVSREVVVEP